MTYLNFIFLNSLGFVYEQFHFSTDQKELSFWALVAWYLIVSMISIGQLTLIYARVEFDNILNTE